MCSALTGTCMSDVVANWENDRWNRRGIPADKDVKNTWPIVALRSVGRF